MIFLKLFDDKEQEYELLEDDYRRPIPDRLRWRNWAADDEGITGDELLDFVNNDLFPTLKELGRGDGDRRARIVKSVFEDALQLHEVRDAAAAGGQQAERDRLHDVERPPPLQRHLRDDPQGPPERGQRGRVLHAARRDPVHDGDDRTRSWARSSSTPRAAPAASSWTPSSTSAQGGEDAWTTGARSRRTIRGVEKKPLPHMLATTNLILHDIEVPQVRARQHARPAAPRLRPG